MQTTYKFGDISSNELELQDCDFDKNAEALVLFDIGKFACFFYPSTRTGITTEFNRHLRIKILNEKGLKWANIRIPYFSSAGEKIKNVSAQTYNTDGSGKVVVSKVEKSLIYDKKVTNRLSEKTFAFGDVKVGSIIEYKYTVAESGLYNWYFQKDIPVKYSSYTVDYPHDFQLLSTPVCVLPVEQNIQRDQLRTVRSFSMKDVMPIRDEPYIDCSEDYLQRVESNILSVTTSSGSRYNLMPGWPTVLSGLMQDPDFGIQLEKGIPEDLDLQVQLKAINDPYHKMNIIYRYVQENMEWNGVKNIWAVNGIKSAWQEKKGTAGEINLILINLLRNAGLDVYPMLVSTRDHGKIHIERPGINQFNKVLAYVKVADKFFVLDGTQKFTPYNLIPSEVMSTWALIYKKSVKDKDEWEWNILWNEEKKYKNNIDVKANISHENLLTGEALISSYDYARVESFSALKSDSLKYINQKLSGGNPALKIDSFSIGNLQIDTMPLIQKIRFAQPIASLGDYKYFSMNLFTGFEKNPFLSDTRFSDIFFGVNQEYSFRGTFTAPTGYSFEEVPKDNALTLADNSISVNKVAAVSRNTLTVTLNVVFKKPIYERDKYESIQEFYKKLFALLNEQYVLRKS